MYDLQRYLGWSDQGLKDDVIYNLKFFVSCMETVLYLLIIMTFFVASQKNLDSKICYVIHI